MRGCKWGAACLAAALALPPALSLPALTSPCRDRRAFCLLQVITDPKLSKSGAYWSWSSTTGSFDNQVSEEVADDTKATKLWDVSAKLVGLSA